MPYFFCSGAARAAAKHSLVPFMAFVALGFAGCQHRAPWYRRTEADPAPPAFVRGENPAFKESAYIRRCKDKLDASEPLGFAYLAKKGTQEVVLMGTFHGGTVRDSKLTPALLCLIDASEAVATELDIREAQVTLGVALQSESLERRRADAYKRRYVLPKGDSLAAHLTPETLRRLERVLSAKDLAAIATFLSERLGETITPERVGDGAIASAYATMLSWRTQPYFPFQYAPDIAVEKRAREVGIAHIALETLDLQLDWISSLQKDPETELKAILDRSVEQDAVDFHKLHAYWQDGDLGSFERAAGLVITATMFRAIDARNPHMVDGIEACAKRNDKCFVAVGAAHLIGKGSVNGLLAKRGFSIDRIK